MIGQTISHYKILEKLGEGGMGVVYKAQDTKLDRVVALKFLPHNISTNEAEKGRFLQEARAAAALNHPNICTVHAVEESDGDLFIIMEYIDGPSLRKKIESRPLSPAEAVGIAKRIAQGLEAAHKKGIVHRDLKPENILLTNDGSPKIADFGLAVPEHLLQTSTGGRSGTIAYMAPEQLQGSSVDHRADIWSFGIILHEMLTGRRPFASEYHQALVYSILNERHLPVSQLRDGISGSLEKFLNKCLEKNPALRFADSSELLGELRVIAKDFRTVENRRTRSIAVLPFEDLSPSKDNKYFSDGLHDEIIANLSKLRNLSVLSRSSILRYERLEKTIKEIAGELGVQYVLEGSVRKHGSNLRITTQLIDANQEVTLWAENFKGTMDEIFDIQEEVGSSVVKALKVRLTPSEKRTFSRRATKNTEAFQLYLKGRFFWNKRNREGLLKSIHFFEDAIAKDPRFARAWSGLSDAYNLLPDFANHSRKETALKARKAAERALQLDNRLAEAHTSLALLLMVNDWDWVNAEKEFKTAIRLDPRYATARHWYSEWLRYKGHLDESLSEISIAVELDPLSPAILKDKAMTLYYARRYDEAMEFARKCLELESQFTPAYRLLALCYLGKGMIADGIRANERWGELMRNKEEETIGLAQLYAAGGKKQDALQAIEGLLPTKGTSGILARGIALVYAILGEKDRAFEWLETSYEQHAESLCSLKVDPKADNLRSDERFSSLLKRIGLED